MKKSILFIFAILSFLVVIDDKALADIIPEFETIATITNTEGAKAFQIVETEVSQGETTDELDDDMSDNDLPYVKEITTIPYNAVVYGDSVSSAPIAITALIKDAGSDEVQRLSLYTIKYNNQKYLVYTGDVSQFKLNDTVIETPSNEVIDNTTNNKINETTNPTTGMMEVVATWVIAGLSVTFSFYYFIRYMKFR